MILQLIRIIVGYARFEPGTSLSQKHFVTWRFSLKF